MANVEEQQFCLRWNNFQANFTSQFEILRDDEDFTDVTIACEGQRIQAHKIVLSACSPYFKELFKTNPCSHPIIFMRDVEAHHILSLMEFMYAGEVNVAQAHLSAFLKTAESLKIRGLTDTSTDSEIPNEENTLYLNPTKTTKNKSQIPTSTVTSSQDEQSNPSPPPKKQCKSDNLELPRLRPIKEEKINPFAILEPGKATIQPKVELPDYLSDDDGREEAEPNYFERGVVPGLPGGMEIIPQGSGFNLKTSLSDTSQGNSRLRRRRSSETWFSNTFGESTSTDASPTRFRNDWERKNRLIKLSDGIEIYEDQLRSVKWSDYRKLTRGLATILFSPAELATCSVTGQRWSRAGSGERPVKPALDRAKVQAIISYVATRFPMVEISRIKQVLAYKCKENSTAFKMKAVRYYSDQPSPKE